MRDVTNTERKHDDRVTTWYGQPAMRRLLVLATAAILIAGAAACEPTTGGSNRKPKEFGAAVSPYSVDDWTAAVGAHPTASLMFEHWSSQRNLDKEFTEARRQHLRSVMVSWEP